MRMVCIADTHGHHEEIMVPDGDLLIHAGDCTIYGHSGDLKDFLKWFASLPHCNKVLIAGNHDWIFEREPTRASEIIKRHAPNIIYLENTGCITDDGFKIWGSPVTPPFMNWAFNWEDDKRRGLWAGIPADDTDILVTHGPMFGGRDTAPYYQNATKRVGDKELFYRLGVIHTPYHICGHIHNAYGSVQIGSTIEINASICNEAYMPVNTPIVVDL
jgi:Icc-related predicted phosphoesterase